MNINMAISCGAVFSCGMRVVSDSLDKQCLEHAQGQRAALARSTMTLIQ